MTLPLPRLSPIVITLSVLLPSSIVAQSPPASVTAGDRFQQDCQLLFAQQRYLDATQPCLQAVKWYQRQQDRDGLAAALYAQGLVFQQLSRYPEAILNQQEAVALYRRLDNQDGQAKALLALGDARRGLGNHEFAITYYQEAAMLYRRLDQVGGEAEALMNIGIAYHGLSRYQLALSFYQDARPRFMSVRDRQGEARAVLQMGHLYRDLAQPQRALKFYQDALPVFLQFRITHLHAATVMGLGNVYRDLAKPDEAIAQYSEALNLFRRIPSLHGEARTLLHLGQLRQTQGKTTTAIAHQEQALRLFKGVQDWQGEADAHYSLGVTYHRSRQPQLAMPQFERALVLYRRIKDQVGAARTLQEIGNLHAQAKRLTMAETTLRQGIRVWETTRTELQADRDRVALFDQQRTLYDLLQQVLVAQNRPLDALEVAEQGRARAFVELVTAQQLPRDQRRLATAPLTVAEMQTVARQQQATLVQYSLIGAESVYIWVISPQGKIRFHPVDLSSLPASPSKTGLASLLTRTRNLDLQVRSRSTSFEFVENPAVTHEAAVFDRTASGAAPRQDYPYLRELYQLLIAPIASDLPTDADQRIIFIPQGQLFLVPFPALQSADGRFLVDQYTISTAPAIQILQLTHQQRQRLQQQFAKSGSQAETPACRSSAIPCAPSSQSWLIVGNPTMPQIGDPPRSLSRLPGAEAEAQAIATLFNTQPLIGADARKATVVQQMRSARLIHLATHGLLDDYRGLGVPGAIALAPDGQPRRGEIDGLLTASEILQLDLVADLVVLSACDTGLGQIRGDGVIGLSRSLISAGTPSVIVSLWQVPDDTTSVLMQEFYQHLKQPRINKAEALRQAMLKTKQIFPNPKDWAAFTLIGEAE